jgi:hypothetical protein
LSWQYQLFALSVNLYTVDETAINDGLLNHYRVGSIYGDFQVVSTPALKQILYQIQTIALMKKVAAKDTVTDSLVQSGKNTVDGVKIW